MVLFPFPKAHVNFEVSRISQAVQRGNRLAGMAASAQCPGVCWVIDGHCSEVMQSWGPPRTAVMRPAARPRHPRGHAALDGEIILLFPSCCTVHGKLIHMLLRGPASAININVGSWFWTSNNPTIGWMDRKGSVHWPYSVLPQNGFHYVFPYQLRCFHSDRPCRRILVFSNQNGCERSVLLFIHFY